MAFILSDRVKETTTTTGTGSVVLGGTIDASTTFSAAIGNGNSTYYCIESPDGNYEVGIGTYTSASNSLSRDTVISSSNSGSKISLVGVSNVFCTQPGPKAVFINSVGLVSGVDTSFEGFAFPDGTIQYTSATSGNAPITIERQNSGVFFNYFINNAYDETVSLHLEDEQYPRFKLGLRDTAEGNSAPTYGYLFGEQGYAGGVGDSTCEFFVANNNGFWIKHNSQYISNFAQDDGIIFQNVSAASPVFIVKGNAAQAADLQRWDDNSSTTLAKVTKEGHVSGVELHTPTISFADGTTQTTAGYTGTGDINVKQYIYHDGDSNTYIRFRGDQLDFVAGGRTMLTLDEASNDKVVVNDGGNNVDFQVEGENDANLIRTDAANDRVGIGTSSPSYLLDVAGSGSFEGIRFSDGTTQATSFAADVATASGALRADITTNTAAIPASGYAISGALQSQIDNLGGASISYVDAATSSGVANSGFLSEELHEISGVGGLIANKSNWDTAYGWGDHSSAGYLTSQTSHADVVVDGDFSSQGLMKRGFSGGSYSIVTDNSSNWNTAYGWGDHVPYVDAATASGVANSGFFSEELHEVSGVAGLIPSTVADSGYAISGALQVQIDGISGASVAYVDAATASGVANSGFFSEELHEVSGVGGLISSTVADSGYAISGALQVQIDGIGGASVSYVDAATASGVANSGFFSEELHEVSGVGGLITSTIANSGYHISGVLQPQITANTTAIPASGYRISGVLQPQISSNTTAIPASGYHISGVLQPQITTNTTAIPASGYHISGVLQPQISSNTSNISTNTTAIPASGYHISGVLQPQITANTTAIPASGYHISGVLQPQITTNAAAIPASGYHISGILQTQITNLNHDTLTGFVANEHIDWTADQGGTNIHTGNYDNTTYTAGSGIELQGTEFNVAISGNNILATNTPSDNYVPSYDLATGKFTWVENTGGASDINGLSDCLVENNSIFLGNDPSSTTNAAQHNTAVGVTALDSITQGDYNVAIGNLALDDLTVGHSNVAIGYKAGDGMTEDDYNVYIGYEVAESTASIAGNSNVKIGYKAGRLAHTDQGIFIGANAGNYIGDASNKETYVIGIGSSAMAGTSSNVLDNYGSVGVGASAGNGVGHGAASHYCLYLGFEAGYNADDASNMLYIANDEPSTTGAGGTIIKADMEEKHLAIGQADLLTNADGSAALQVYSKDPDDPSIYAQPYLGSEADLIHFNSGTQEMFNVGWDGSITTSGTIYASGAITASGSIVLNRFVPSVTTNALYNDAGTLKFNGSTIGGGGMSNFILEDGDGTEVTIGDGKEVKFVEGDGIDIDWTDVSDGSDGDPYDLTFTVDHDAASNYVANEHIDHTSVSITAGDGLSGGGTIASTRTLNVDINGATDLGSPATGDELLIADADDNNNIKKADVASVVNLADHDALTNFVANEHINHTSVTLTAGDGLTGGGDISANRSFAVSVDDSTIEINSDSLRVKADGIGSDQIADDAINSEHYTDGSIDTAHIGDDQVTYAKIQNVTDARMLGNNAGSDGAVTEMTKANVLSFLNVEDGATAAGTVTAINNATANELVTIGSTTTELDAQANLTFDGSTLTLAGVADITDATDASDATGDTGALRCEGGASIAKKLYVGTDLDVDGTTNLDAVDIDGNVQIDGTLTVGVNDTGQDVKFFGATAGSYLEWDESADRLHLVQGAFVNQPVPATGGTNSGSTLQIDLSKGNYHNITLNDHVGAIEFQNATIGQKFIIRFTQESTARTVFDTGSFAARINGSVAAELKWAGNVVPTMSTSDGHKDVYGFLCTATGSNANDTKFDGFIIGQDIPN